MDDKEIIYDHYKDTFSIIKNEEGKRNKYFIIILLHILILFLISINEVSVYSIIKGIIKENFNVDICFGINVIQLVMMFSMLYLTIRYFQVNIHIDRLYKYLHNVEQELSDKVSKSISREGKSYLSNYPKTLDVIYCCYKYIFPLVYIIALVVRVFINDTWNNWIVKLIEFLITIMIIILNVFYIIDSYNSDNKN